METNSIDDAPSQVRVIATLLFVVLLAAFNMLLLGVVFDALPKRMLSSNDGNKDTLVNVIFLGEALLLCLVGFRKSGLGIGELRRWMRRFYAIALFWIMPPLLVLTLYTVFTDKPFHQWPMGWWLIGSVAQEFLFAGFIYGQMTVVFGPPEEGTGGAFSAPVLFTAFLYSLSHWPNLTTNELGMSTSYVQLQLVYTFVGYAWMLNIRRWTGSVWLLVLNHILVNFLAAFV